jgi:hypothetical protein
MRALPVLGGLALAVLVVGSASAAKNSNRVEANASPDAAWAAVGDFCGVKNWHPAIADCTLSRENGAEIRTLTTKDGGKFVEKLVKWDDKNHSYTYEILESPLPVTRYVSTFKVEEDDEPGKVAIIWSAEFEPKGATEREARAKVGEIYVAGLLGLKSKLPKK